MKLRKFCKRYTPGIERLQQYKSLRFFGINRPHLWRFNRHCITRAVAIGLFCAFLPLPGQMAVAAACAVFFRANIPVSIALVWITNPVTLPVVFYAAYRVGLVLLGWQAPPIDAVWSFDMLFTHFARIGTPLWVGSLFLGSISALLGFFITRQLWIYCVLRTVRKKLFP